MKRKFVLKKGIIKKTVNNRVYLVNDFFTADIIVATLSSMEVIKGIFMQEGDVVYIVVSPEDFSRGRFFSELDIRTEYGSDLLRDKALLDNQSND